MLANLYRVMFIVWHDSHFKFDFSISIFQHIKHIRIKQEWVEGVQTSMPKWQRPERWQRRFGGLPHTRTFMSLDIKSLV
jgi:hypothetical protein